MTVRPVRFVVKYFAVLSSAAGVAFIAQNARGTCNFRRKGYFQQRSESQYKDLKPEEAGVLGLFQMPPTAFSVRGKEYILLWKKPWILVKYDVRMLGAKNNDSPSEKWVIVKFYTMEYGKCGNFNSKNDSRPCMGASTIPQSVDFKAFAANVKTIAPKKYLYQFGHAIWWYTVPMAVHSFLKKYDFLGENMQETVSC